MSSQHTPPSGAPFPGTPFPGTPILAPPGASAAEASRPDQPLEETRYHIYESHPAPWWLALIWLTFLICGAAYLIVNLLRSA